MMTARRRGYDRQLIDLSDRLHSHPDFGRGDAELVSEAEMEIRRQATCIRRLGDAERCPRLLGHAFGAARCRRSHGHSGDCDFRPPDRA